MDPLIQRSRIQKGLSANIAGVEFCEHVHTEEKPHPNPVWEDILDLASVYLGSEEYRPKGSTLKLE